MCPASLCKWLGMQRRVAMHLILCKAQQRLTWQCMRLCCELALSRCVAACCCRRCCMQALQGLTHMAVWIQLPLAVPEPASPPAAGAAAGQGQQPAGKGDSSSRGGSGTDWFQYWCTLYALCEHSTLLGELPQQAPATACWVSSPPCHMVLLLLQQLIVACPLLCQVWRWRCLLTCRQAAPSHAGWRSRSRPCCCQQVSAAAAVCRMYCCMPGHPHASM